MSFFAGLVQGLGGTLAQQHAQEAVKKQRDKEFQMSLIIHKAEDPNLTYDEQEQLLDHLGTIDKKYKGIGRHILGQMNDGQIAGGAPIHVEGNPHPELPDPIGEAANLPPPPSMTLTPQVRRGGLSPAGIQRNQKTADDLREQDQALERIQAQGRAYSQRQEATQDRLDQRKGDWFVDTNTGSSVFWSIADGPPPTNLVPRTVFQSDRKEGQIAQRTLRKEVAILQADPKNAGRSVEDLAAQVSQTYQQKEQLKEAYLKGMIKLNDVRSVYMSDSQVINNARLGVLLTKLPYEIEALKTRAASPNPQVNAMQTDYEQLQTFRLQAIKAQKETLSLSAEEAKEESMGNIEKAQELRAKAAGQAQYAAQAASEVDNRIDTLKGKYGDAIEVTTEDGLAGVNLPSWAIPEAARKGMKTRKVKIKSGVLPSPPSSKITGTPEGSVSRAQFKARYAAQTAGKDDDAVDDMIRQAGKGKNLLIVP